MVEVSGTRLSFLGIWSCNYCCMYVKSFTYSQVKHSKALQNNHKWTLTQTCIDESIPSTIHQLKSNVIVIVE